MKGTPQEKTALIVLNNVTKSSFLSVTEILQSRAKFMKKFKNQK